MVGPCHRRFRRPSGSIRRTMCQPSLRRMKKGFQRSNVPVSRRRLWRTLGPVIPHRVPGAFQEAEEPENAHFSTAKSAHFQHGRGHFDVAAS